MSVNEGNAKTNFIDRNRNEGTTTAEIPEPRIAVLGTYTLLGSLYCVFSSILFFSAASNNFLGIAHVAALACVLINYLILLKTRQYTVASNVLLGIGAVVVVILFATGGWEKTGFLWPVVYLPFAFFLSEKSTGMVWAVFIFCGSLMAMLLHVTGTIDGVYTVAEYTEYFAGLAMLTACLFAFSKAVVKRAEFLKYANAVMQAAPDAAIMLNDKGEITRWNEKAEILFGWNASEVTGRLLSSVIIPQRYRDAHRKGLKNFLDMREGISMSKSMEIKALNRDNEEFDVSLSIAPLIGKKKYISFVKDLTQQNLRQRESHRSYTIANSLPQEEVVEKLRTAEINYQEVFDKANDAIYVHEIGTGKVIQVNHRATEVTGYTKEELLTTDPHEFITDHPNYTFEHAINYIQKAAMGIPQLFEWLGKKKDGTHTWFEVNLKKATIAGEERILAFFHEITARKAVEHELLESQNILRELTAHLHAAREEERTHLAREVHDVLGQQITGLKMDMTWLNKKITNKDEAVEERFAEMISLADDMVKTIRKISSELRPGILDDLGLVPALEWQSSEFEKRTGIQCNFTSDNTLPDITPKTATGIFRIYQETLTNVARHAHATKVNVSMSCDAISVVLVIADNGRGLNAAEMKLKKTLGIAGMRERAAMLNGYLTVQSGDGGGTVVTLSVPVSNRTDA